MYDQSFRTPIIFSWANKIKAGVVKDNLMHSADIPATILDYVGIEIPEDYFGQSYRSVTTCLQKAGTDLGLIKIAEANNRLFRALPCL